MPIDYLVVTAAIDYQLVLIKKAFAALVDKPNRDINIIPDFAAADGLYTQGRALKLADVEIAQTGEIQTVSRIVLGCVSNALDAYHGSKQALQIGESAQKELEAILLSKAALAELM